MHFAVELVVTGQPASSMREFTDHFVLAVLVLVQGGFQHIHSVDLHPAALGRTH